MQVFGCPGSLPAGTKRSVNSPGRQAAGAPAITNLDTMQFWLILLATDVLLLSLLTLGLYAWDKRQAGRRGWRVAEKRLHLLSLLGGWPGALIGQRWLRHKSIKARFRFVFWLTVVLHVSISAGITYIVATSMR